MKNFKRIPLLALLASGLAVLPLTAAGQQTNPQQSTFKGTISSYDASANTVRVDGQTYQLLPTSRITKSDAPGSSATPAVGQEIEGQYKESAEGKREVLTASVKPKTNTNVADTREAGTFQGEIASYNKSANTLRVDGETYQVLPTSRILRATSAMTTNNLAEGQQVTGRYKESAEGRREVLSMEIARGTDRAVGAAQDSLTTESGATFQGRIGRLNRDANTLIVGGTTYHILPTTRIIGRSGSAITLRDINRDQRVNGTYKESADGRREVLSMEIGRRDNNNNND